MNDCPFCSIVNGSEAANIVYDSERVLSFLSLRPTRTGECLIIPKKHVDQFINLDYDTASEIIQTSIRIGRKMMEEFQPMRVGIVVHGFGVAHAHMILLPQHDSNDITSGRFASIENGEVVFDHRNIPRAEPSVLDDQARLLRIEPEA